LFSGVGGTCLAIEDALGADTIWHVEYDKACQGVLANHWPGVPCYGDVTTLDFTELEPVDVLSASYPCQPFSHAGNRKGTEDERHLWPYVAAAIRVLRPQLVVLENVAGHLSLGFDKVLCDLAEMGFDAEWGIVRASDVGAPHRRERLFVVAYPSEVRWGGGGVTEQGALTERPQEHRVLPPAYPSGERHGDRVHAGAVGRVDGQDEGEAREWERSRQVPIGRGAETLFPTPTARDWKDTGDFTYRDKSIFPHEIQKLGEQRWGIYAPAIARWERILGRPAPEPTDDKRRLNPDFVVWMMGLPENWLHGSRTQQLKQCGNAVVPQQGAYAIRALVSRFNEGVKASRGAVRAILSKANKEAR
jgi:DNA (cytosine-5)-methyltransferase 1